MPKKAKIGKARKDKFYRLAKETGYRSRASFKLLHLNRKFEFLQKSRVLIDLCAAPGSWTQVAATTMPVSSLIIGVDLVPIKPIPNCILLQEDITTEKCRQSLKREMKDWKADCVLNDGAPNVGKNWLHDAFSQAQLTLHALKLATEFLRKGGWFVTKVFRSKDYQALIWVFGQLFKKVHATKPQASRNESAEIFVVCQGFKAPDSIDPKFLDPRHVFKEVDDQPKKALNLVHPEKVKRKAEGYADGDYTLYHTLKASDFITSENHLELLANCNEITMDSTSIAKHNLTTNEIKECCKDIKVLGKKEIRTLLTWRKKLKAFLEAEIAKEEKKSEPTVEKEDEESEDEESQIEKQLLDLKEEEMKDDKRKKRKVRKEKAKLQHKMDMKMIIPGDKIETSDDISLFNLKNIKNKHQLSEVENSDLDVFDEDGEKNDESSDDELPMKRKQMIAYDKYTPAEDYYDNEESGDESNAEDDDFEWESDGEDENKGTDDGEGEEEEPDERNPLLVQLEDKDTRTDRRTEMWFSKDAFSGLGDDDDEDLEIEKMSQAYKKKGGTVLEKSNKDHSKKKAKQKIKQNEGDLESNDTNSDSGHVSESSQSDNDMDTNLNTNEVEAEDDDSDTSSSDSDSDYDMNQSTMPVNKGRGKETLATKGQTNKDGFEIVPAVDLGAEGLALGAALIHSRKRRRDIIDDAYNRYTFDDEGLPDWFVKDESKHTKKQLPVTKEEVNAYMDRQKAINARPVKKLAESKARKKRKAMKKLEKARKKAEAITDTVDVTDKEKWQQIKQIYKRAGLLNKQKRELTYVVAKKGVGKRVSRPSGVKGQFKVVDPRMKKDNRVRKNDLKSGKRGRKGKGRR